MRTVVLYELVQKEVYCCGDYVETMRMPYIPPEKEWRTLGGPDDPSLLVDRDTHKISVYRKHGRDDRYVAIHNDAREILDIETSIMEGLESRVRSLEGYCDALREEVESFHNMGWKDHLKACWTKLRSNR